MKVDTSWNCNKIIETIHDCGKLIQDLNETVKNMKSPWRDLKGYNTLNYDDDIKIKLEYITYLNKDNNNCIRKYLKLQKEGKDVYLNI